MRACVLARVRLGSRERPCLRKVECTEVFSFNLITVLVKIDNCRVSVFTGTRAIAAGVFAAFTLAKIAIELCIR